MRHVRETMPPLREYIDSGRIRYVYRPYVFHKVLEDRTIRLAAEALYCAGDQDKFWEMHDWEYAHLDEWAAAPDVLRSFVDQAGSDLGLQAQEFESCLQEERYRKRVAGISANAEMRPISSVPHFLINGTDRDGPLSIEEFRQLIRAWSAHNHGWSLLLMLALPCLFGLVLAFFPGPLVSLPVFKLRMVMAVLALLGVGVSGYWLLYGMQFALWKNLTIRLSNSIFDPSFSPTVDITTIGVIGYGLFAAITLARLKRRTMPILPVGLTLVVASGLGLLLSAYLVMQQIILSIFGFWHVAPTLIMMSISSLAVAAYLAERREEVEGRDVPHLPKRSL